MKLRIILTSFFATLLAVTFSYGQSNILNAKSPEEIGLKTLEELEADEFDEPLPYGYVDDRDILYSKTIWEYIDLNQKANFPLLFPLDENQLGGHRKSLFYVLIDNIKNGNIPSVYTDSYFTQKASLDDLEATLHDRDTLNAGIDQLNAGEELDEQYVNSTDIDGSDVMGYRIRGMFYFDKRQGDMRYRLLGIAPMVISARDKALGTEDPEPVELFWVFYPDAREVLYRAKVFNEANTAHPFNYDQILNSRRFSAVIYKEDNDYGDRAIADYIGDNALKQLLEAERIKEEIRDFESNMWNY